MLTRLHRDERGSALLVSLAVMSIAVILGLVVVGVTISEEQSAGRDRQRVVSMDSAEGAVDEAYAAIQTATAEALPCNLSGTTKAAPDNPAYTVTITYVAPDGTQACPLPNGVRPVQAVIVATAQTATTVGGTATKQRMDALVNLTPIYANGFNKAIFSNSGLTLNNHATVRGNNGPDADLYSNGTVTCANNQTYEGSIIAQGSINFSSSCTTSGDLWAGVGVSSTNNSSIGGRVRAAGGDVTLSGNTSVASTLRATGTITWPSCTASKCFSSTAVPAPTYQPFPIVNGDNATIDAWQAAGFTNFVDWTDCAPTAGGSNRAADWILEHASSLPADTVFRTTCSVPFVHPRNVSLNHDLAIFAYGGISSSQSATFDSNDHTMRKMYWIIPYDAAAPTCSSPAMTTDNLFSTGNYLDLMLYSPCNITFSNNGQHMGQIYSASTVSINNNFDLQYHPMPMYGVVPESQPVASYSVDVVYKRQAPAQ